MYVTAELGIAPLLRVQVLVIATDSGSSDAGRSLMGVVVVLLLWVVVTKDGTKIPMSWLASWRDHLLGTGAVVLVR